MDHVAIQNPKYTFGPIYTLSVLCRCRQRKDVPYDRVSVGDTVYVQSGGVIKVRVTVSRVDYRQYSNIALVRSLCKGTSLYGGHVYWDDMRDRHYATVARLSNHERLQTRFTQEQGHMVLTGSCWTTSRGDANGLTCNATVTSPRARRVRARLGLQTLHRG